MVEAELHRLVDVLGAGDPLVEGEAGLVEHGHQHPVDDEAGDVARDHRGLAEALSEGAGGGVGLVGGGQAADDLHQLHQRHRVHEVHADEAVGPLGAGRERGDADGRGVGGEDHAWPACMIEVAEDLLLDRGALRRCLHHEVDVAQIADAPPGPDAASDGVALGARHLPLLDELVELRGHRGTSLVGEGGGGVDDGHLAAGGRGHLGDPASHLAGTDDAQPLDHAHGRSTATAIASPPPMHSEATPRFPPLSASAASNVTSTRAPLAPMGWPRAMAPPQTFTRRGSRPSFLLLYRATTAKASFSSQRSTSPTFQPTLPSRRSMAAAGAVVNHCGSWAWLETPTMRARGLHPRDSAVSAPASTSAAAPSLIGGALPAVMVPSFWKAGRSDGSLSGSPFVGVSSSMTRRGGPFRCGTSTGTISPLNFPSAWARRARRNDSAA